MRLLVLILVLASASSAQSLREVRERAREFSSASMATRNTRAGSLKDSLRRWLEAEVRRMELVPSVASMNDRLRSAGITEKEVEPLQLEMLAPDLALIRVTLSYFDCGKDEAAWLFRNEGGWRPAIDLYTDSPAEKPPLPSLVIAKVSGVTRRGSRLFVAAGFDSWCSSTWHHFRWTAWELPAAGPALFLRSSAQMGFRDGEDGTDVSPDGLVIRYSVGSHSPDIHNRHQVERFAFRDDGSLQRIEPYATSGVNFYEEWLNQPWSVAREWSSGVDLERVHAALRNVTFEFGPVRVCGDFTQIEVDDERIPGGFVVVRTTGKEQWRIKGFSTAPVCQQ